MFDPGARQLSSLSSLLPGVAPCDYGEIKSKLCKFIAGYWCDNSYSVDHLTKFVRLYIDSNESFGMFSKGNELMLLFESKYMNT